MTTCQLAVKLLPFSAEGPLMLILLIEDEPLIEIVAEDILTEAGHEVLTARTGNEALSAFRNANPPPDALVIDNRLPDMLGCDVAETCRSFAPAIHIVMCSADMQAGARPLRGVVHVGKPYTGEQLLTALDNAVSST